MERYCDNYFRLVAHENAIAAGQATTCEQLHDICTLIREGKTPDSHFSDFECAVYELLKVELG